MGDMIYIGDEWPSDGNEEEIEKLLKKDKREIILLAASIIKKLQDPDSRTATCRRCIMLGHNATKYIRPHRAKPCHRCLEYEDI